MSKAEQTGANLFESLPLNEKQQALRTNLLIEAGDLYKAIEVIPNSREKSLAVTKLEEVVMWANKGISRNP